LSVYRLNHVHDLQRIGLNRSVKSTGVTDPYWRQVMSRVAFATGGILRQARGHEQVQGFIDWLQSVFEAAETTEGFIDRSRWEKEGGDRVDPHFFDKNKHAFVAPTLSVLVDLLSVYAFAYNGRHAEALSHRKDWFSMLYWPAYVVWPMLSGGSVMTMSLRGRKPGKGSNTSKTMVRGPWSVAICV